jgi:hypothetical protein
MFSQSEIEKEVRAVFDDMPIILITEYIVNEDAITIKIINRSKCNTLPAVTAKISALEELMCNNKDESSKLLRTYINEMRNTMESNSNEERKLLT